MKNSLKNIPRIANPQIIPKIVQPHPVPRSGRRVIGVYDPAINKKIEEWSIILK